MGLLKNASPSTRWKSSQQERPQLHLGVGVLCSLFTPALPPSLSSLPVEFAWVSLLEITFLSPYSTPPFQGFSSKFWFAFAFLTFFWNVGRGVGFISFHLFNYCFYFYLFRDSFHWWGVSFLFPHQNTSSSDRSFISVSLCDAGNFSYSAPTGRLEKVPPGAGMGSFFISFSIRPPPTLPSYAYNKDVPTFNFFLQSSSHPPLSWFFSCWCRCRERNGLWFFARIHSSTHARLRISLNSFLDSFMSSLGLFIKLCWNHFKFQQSWSGTKPHKNLDLLWSLVSCHWRAAYLIKLLPQA